ncbi:MAG: SPFH domain-containing protein, partial [Candidatus Korarchaeota archaeon]|nr:SPFH domain-containing protein [Candidatus Korarchaeota archaeon]
TLRAVIGEMLLDEVLAKRDEINNILRVKLDEVTERWGVKITNVEIREILPPRPVQEAMIKQMAAERNRRAMVTEAEGKKEAAIRVAEGEKQAAILKAEGDRQAAILRAEGYAIALKTIAEVARELDENTMKLQYLEGLKTIGTGESTKILLPVELLEMVKDWLKRAGSEKGSE